MAILDNIRRNIRHLLPPGEQTAFAKRINMSGPLLSNYLNRGKEPGVAQIEKIAAGLGVTVADLIGEEPPAKLPEPKIEQMKLTAITRIIRLTREEDVQGIIEFLDTFLDRSAKKNQRRTAGP